MIWEIYSIGDAEFLTHILVGVALVTGTGDFREMVRVGLALGVLLVIFQAIRSGGRGIDLSQILIGWLVYAMFIAPPATVAVTSVYDGTVRTVDRVPLGVAAVGSLASKVGVSTTRLMETAFSTPAMTSRGYASALETLKRLRVHGLVIQNLGAANVPVAGSNFAQSWINYIKECTLPGIGTRNIAPDSIHRSANTMAALRFNSQVKRTEIYVGGAPQNMNCGEAHTELAAFTTTSFLPAYQRVIYRVLGLTSAAEVDAEVDEALSALGVLGVSATDYQISTVLQALWDEAVTQEYTELGRANYATMVQDAVRARNAQWMAQQSVFSTYVRPMLTFLEGFAYAAMPILAILLVIGAFGFSLAGRYVQLLFWIQLWTPVLAIVNLYIHRSVTRAFAAMDDAGHSLSSFTGLIQSDDVLTRWLAVGGLIASSTPVLAMFLTSGATSALGSMAGRLSTGENVVPEVAGPRTVRMPWGRYDFASSGTWDPTAGSRSTGVERILPTFSFTRDNWSSVESSRNAREGASESLRGMVGRSFSVMSQRGESTMEGQTTSQREASGQSEFLGSVQSRLGNVADTISKSFGVTREDAMSFVAGLAAGGKGSTSGNASFSNGTTLSSQQQQQAQTMVQSAISEQEGLRASLDRSLANDVLSGRSRQYLGQQTAAESQEMTRAAERVVSSDRAYQDAQRQSVGTGVRESIGAVDAVNAIENSPRAKELLAERLMHLGRAGTAFMYAKAHPELNTHFGSAERAQIFAGLRALQGDTGLESRQATTLQQQYGDRSLAQVIGTAVGSEWRSPTGAAANDDMARRIPAAPGSVLPGGSSNLERARAGLGSEIAGRLAAPSATPDLGATHGQNVETLRARAVEQVRPATEAIRAMETAAANALQDKSWQERLMTEGRGMLGGHAHNLVRSMASGSREAVVQEATDWALSQGLTPTQAQLYGVRAAYPTPSIVEAAARSSLESFPSIHQGIFGQVDALEADVAREARSMGMDPQAVVGLIRDAGRVSTGSAADEIGQLRAMNQRRSERAPAALSEGLRRPQ